jgi:hypothetical protein
VSSLHPERSSEDKLLHWERIDCLRKSAHWKIENWR